MLQALIKTKRKATCPENLYCESILLSISFFIIFLFYLFHLLVLPLSFSVLFSASLDYDRLYNSFHTCVYAQRVLSSQLNVVSSDTQTQHKKGPHLSKQHKLTYLSSSYMMCMSPSPHLARTHVDHLALLSSSLLPLSAYVLPLPLFMLCCRDTHYVLWTTWASMVILKTRTLQKSIVLGTSLFQSLTSLPPPHLTPSVFNASSLFLLNIY